MKADRDAVANLIKLLEEGQTLETIAQARAPAGQADAVRLVALPRTFDQTLFSTLVPDGILSYDALTESIEVEPAPGRTDQYRVAPTYRTKYIRRWIDKSGGPESARSGEIGDLSAQLADHYREGPVTDRLYHLIVSDPDEAALLFEREFAIADGEFDLAKAEALVNVVGAEDRSPFLTGDLDRLLAEQRGYLGARAYWVNAFHDTVHYLSREYLEQHFEDLLAPDGPSILQFHARGGMGKTMQLRWFMARRCLSMSNRTPFAYIDFDAISPTQATSDPWLVLLEIADQFDRQISQRPFRDLTDDDALASVLPVIQRRRDERSDAYAGELSAGLREQFAESVPGRFYRLLKGLDQSRPVVVILDTLEEIHVNAEASLLPLARILFAFVDDGADIRLVFSGRQDLTQRTELGELHDRLAAGRSVRVEEFTDGEALSYLTQVRGIGDEDLANAVVEKAGGMPLKLSLLADHIRQAEGTDKLVTAPEIESYESAEIWYLMERVIDRISDPQVRWLIRYGVIPRQLTLDFVREVVAPWVAEAMAGESDSDDPTGDPEGPVGTEPGERFPIDPGLAGEALDTEALWSKLCRYVSLSSWVWKDPGDSGVLQFHTDVLEPMRSIVRGHAVYRQIHDAALEYYEDGIRRAAPDQRVRYLLEAVYHRFQRFGPAAGKHWHLLVEDAVVAGDNDLALALATELMGTDYMDIEHAEDRCPVEWNGRPMLSEVTMAQAAFETAAARIALGRVDDAGPYLSRAEESEEGRAALPPVRLALAHAAVLRHAQRFADARRCLEQAGARAESAHEVSDVAMARVDLMVATTDEGLAEALREAIECLKISDRGSSEIERLGYLLAGELVTRGKVDAALEEYRRMKSAASDPAAVPEAYLGAAAANILIGAPLGLESINSAAEDPELALQVSFLNIRAALDHDNLANASAFVDGASGLLSRNRRAWESVAGEVDGYDGELSELRGLILGEQASADAAFAMFSQASMEFDTAGDFAGTLRCQSHRIALRLRCGGKLREAAKLSDEQSYPGGLRSPETLAARLLGVEIAGRRGTLAEAMGILDEIASGGQVADPWSRAAIAVEGLALGRQPDQLDSVEAHSTALAQALDEIRPVSARATALGGLDRVPVLHDLPSALRDRLAAHAADLLPNGYLAYREGFAAVELLRIAGLKSDASDLLARVGRELSPDARVRSARRRQQAVHRISPTARGAEVSDRDLHNYLGLNECPTLRAVVLTETAERWVASGRQDADEGLDAAEEWLRRTKSLETQWGARLFGAKARLASDNGQFDLADDHVTMAADIYARLGDLIRSNEIHMQRRKEHAAVRAEELHPGLEIHVTLAGVAGPVVANARPIRGDRSVAKAALRPFIAQPIKGDPVHYELLAAMLDNWPSLATDVTEGLFGRWWDSLESPDEMIGLQVEPGPLDRLPWELLLLGEFGELASVGGVGRLYRAAHPKTSLLHRVRAAQVALNQLMDDSLLVDGILGSRTSQALAAYQRSKGLEQAGRLDAVTEFELSRDRGLLSVDTSVFLLRPTFFQEQFVQRGSSVGGVDPEEAYRVRGIGVHVLDNASPEQLLVDLRRGPVPATIHFSTGIGTASSGLYLDFAGGQERLRSSYRGKSAAGGRGQPWTASVLDRILRSIDDKELPPTILLDVPPVPTPSEALRQLVLRNMYAAELFALGNAPVILGTGLAYESLGSEHSDALYGNREEYRSAISVATDIRRTARADLPQNDSTALFEGLGAAGTALFTTTPCRSMPVIQQ